MVNNFYVNSMKVNADEPLFSLQSWLLPFLLIPNRHMDISGEKCPIRTLLGSSSFMQKIECYLASLS